MAHTNWQFGKQYINILTVGILVGKVRVPIAWKVLPQSNKRATPAHLDFRYGFEAIFRILINVNEMNDQAEEFFNWSSVEPSRSAHEFFVVHYEFKRLRFRRSSMIFPFSIA